MNLTNLTTSDLNQLGKLLEKKEALLAQIAEIDRTLANYEGRQSAAVAPKTPARRGRPAVARKAPAARRKKTTKAAKAPARARAKTTTTRAKTAARPAKRGRRGQLKESIIAELQSAGREGLTVKELAERLRVNPGNVRVWFFSTGKKIRNVKKIGPARYRWE